MSSIIKEFIEIINLIEIMGSTLKVIVITEISKKVPNGLNEFFKRKILLNNHFLEKLKKGIVILLPEVDLRTVYLKDMMHAYNLLKELEFAWYGLIEVKIIASESMLEICFSLPD